ncbi:ArsR/SmtB family transcription factor [Caldimonas sp. KR1-144]|uniref:ArsR/SmtB family transcription factor n=1 Tax=Caldimonas sp. KR1-144 TaxID=3400911 RepID=UPI003C05BD28
MPAALRPTPHEPRLARIAALVADASRSRMLSYLLGGEFASAGELARAASVSAATASGHLAQLLDAGLVACEQRGRHRYYRLADADVAHALEALAMVAERTSHAQSWQSPQRARLRFARCCYGHLAGQLGVALFDGLRAQDRLVPREGGGFAVTARGAAALDGLGLDGAAWQRRSSGGAHAARIAYGCIDWSERRDHLAGPLAVALMDAFVERGWLRKQPGERALEWTPTGRQALAGWIRPVGEAQAEAAITSA